jgi:hypothetical protein
VVLLLLGFVVRDETFQYILSGLVYILILNFILALLLVLSRVHVLLSRELDQN